MDAELEQMIDNIGPRLRALRLDRGLTLAALAGVTGLSVSVLSRLESGKRQPTLDLLVPLARAHRVALEQLIGAPATGDPRVHLTPSRSRGGTAVVPLTDYPGRVQVFKHVIGPRPVELRSHPGHAWLYVLAGNVRLILGDSDMVLRPGEIAEFYADQPHWFGPADDQIVEILHLFGPHGDKAQVRMASGPVRFSGSRDYREGERGT
ncbi:helix-turn-helix domain-containing protein [Rhodococcus sp. 27YEA15]|uniref:helix-turn-helix domain-containing protein n=1 Tax=Rhodococcus sp. 27YEA15 TaxID=3156259 RepID=UPI003C7989AE